MIKRISHPTNGISIKCSNQIERQPIDFHFLAGTARLGMVTSCHAAGHTQSVARGCTEPACGGDGKAYHRSTTTVSFSGGSAQTSLAKFAQKVRMVNVPALPVVRSVSTGLILPKFDVSLLRSHYLVRPHKRQSIAFICCNGPISDRISQRYLSPSL